MFLDVEYQDPDLLYLPLSKGKKIAHIAGEKMDDEFRRIGIESDIFVSKINSQGPIILK